MKFHCDRCKTRYSISEERVRGKILKIRCKNCAAVITVREGMDAAPARAASRAGSVAAPAASKASARPGALAGAFADALSRPPAPSAADSLSNAPATLDAEWYVSVDGEQEGPFTLEVARRWVASRGTDEELYCWSEGFDEWLLIDKVSHFRGLRPGTDDSGYDEDERTVIDPGAALGSAAAAMAPVEETPKPLFAATMAAVESNAPTVTEDERLPDPLFKAPKVGDLRPAGKNGVGGGDDGALDFDIGEASRVVKLPLLAQGMGQNGAAPAARSAALPGMASRALGTEAPVDPAMITAGGDAPRPELLQPRKSPRRAMLLPLLAAGALLVGGAVILLLVVGGGGSDDGDPIARGSVGGGGNLGFTFRDEVERGKGGEDEGERAEEKETERRTTSRRPATRPKETRPAKNTEARGGSSATFEEVDLSGGGSKGNRGPLGYDDILEVYRSNQYLVKRCYERALKKDPFLEVSKAQVTISVAKTGRVTSVSIPNLRGTELGTCLTTIIKRWRFREASEVFNTQFPVVFGS